MDMMNKKIFLLLTLVLLSGCFKSDYDKCYETIYENLVTQLGYKNDELGKSVVRTQAAAKCACAK